MRHPIQVPSGIFMTAAHNSQKLICKVCAEGNPRHNHRGMQRQTWRTHLVTDGHAKAVQALHEASRREQATEGPSGLIPGYEPESQDLLFDMEYAEHQCQPEPMDINPVYHWPEEMEEFADESQNEPHEMEFHLEESEEEDLFQDEDSEEIHEIHHLNYATPSTNTSKYYPHESKVMAYLDMLNNLPRHKILSSIMQFVIAILKACIVQDLPSIKRFRKVQKELSIATE